MVHVFHARGLRCVWGGGGGVWLGWLCDAPTHSAYLSNHHSPLAASALPPLAVGSSIAALRVLDSVVLCASVTARVYAWCVCVCARVCVCVVDSPCLLGFPAC
jgi:hypothetical protein